MKGFINDFLNLVQTVVGNNSTGYDVSVLQQQDSMSEGDVAGQLSGDNDNDNGDNSDTHLVLEDDGDFQSEPSSGTDRWKMQKDEDEDAKGNDDNEETLFKDRNWEGKEEGNNDDEYGDGEVAGVGSKRRKDSAGIKWIKKIKVNVKKATAPRTGKSVPATSLSMQKKSRTGLEKFSDIAVKEEEMTQKIIELKKTKAQGVANKEIAKVKSKADVEMNRDKLKENLASKKLDLGFESKRLELEYKYKMAQLTSTPPQVPAANLDATFTLPVHTHQVMPAHHGHLTQQHNQNTFTSGSRQWTASANGSSHSHSHAHTPQHQNSQLELPLPNSSLIDELNSNDIDLNGDHTFGHGGGVVDYDDSY